MRSRGSLENLGKSVMVALVDNLQHVFLHHELLHFILVQKELLQQASFLVKQSVPGVSVKGGTS